MSFRLGLACCSLAFAATAAVLAQTPAAAPDYASNPKFQAALKEAHDQQRKKQMGFASDAYKKANKIAGGQCAECLRSLVDTQMADGAYKDAIASASALEALATTPGSKSVAEILRGRAILAQAGSKPKPAQLEAADAAFKEAIANYPKAAAAHYLDGQTLAKLGKMDEAKAEFLTCVSCVSPNDPTRLRAQHFAENPSLSARQMAPAFTVTALDGSKFTLDEMGGRVVLIDFWATWCGPCNEELPHMKKIAKEFAGQPLVIISVSWDSDETKWKDFIAKNEMTWVQYRDANHALTNSLGINAIPHYFTIDSDGVLTSEMLGEGSDVEGKLKKLVAKAREAQVAATVAQTAGN
jgi:thiol-disulfide isomerase/thioredoxin